MTRFSQSSGSRKYKLNREVYGLKQKGKSVSDYYTEMQVLWQEIDALSVLPTITQSSPEITAFLKALNKLREAQHLFQLLNGLDEEFSSIKSLILMRTTLPSVETVCGILQQEEAQRKILKPHKEEAKVSAMYSKEGNAGALCTACGSRGHPAEKCWRVIGYPKWHPQHKNRCKKVRANGVKPNQEQLRAESLSLLLRMRK